MAADKLYLWMDLETTGLHEEASLLEAYFIITNSNFDVIEEKQFTQFTDKAKWETQAIVMHSENGLIKDIIDRQNADFPAMFHSKIRTFLENWTYKARDEKLIAAGASVHQDKAWLIKTSTAYSMYFSHRVFDTSTLRAFAKQVLGDEVIKAWDDENNAKNNRVRHRAKDDILCSLEFTVWLRNTLKKN